MGSFIKGGRTMRFEVVHRELRECKNCRKVASHVVSHDRIICTFCGNIEFTRSKEVIPIQRQPSAATK